MEHIDHSKMLCPGDFVTQSSMLAGITVAARTADDISVELQQHLRPNVTLKTYDFVLYGPGWRP